MGVLKEFLQGYQQQLTGKDDLPNEITDQYNVEACLKDTQQKQVYIVRSKSDATRYILKCVGGDSQEKLEDEYLLHQTLVHEGIVSAFGFLRVGNRSYLIREYINGSTITDLVEMTAVGHLSSKEIIEISLQLCNILSYLHSQTPPIIHRDIKPDNVIITNNLKCKLIDFGISRRTHIQNERDTIVMGTKFTAPPEQYGFRQTDARSDIYSLGILMFYMATGSLDINEIDQCHISRSLKIIIKKCTSFSPDNRFASVKKLKKRLLLHQFLCTRNIRKKLLLLAILITMCTGVYSIFRYQKNLNSAEEKPKADTISGIESSTTSEDLPENTANEAMQMVPQTNIKAINKPPASKTIMITDESPYQFRSKLIEEAVRTELSISSDKEITYGDLRNVTKLCVCGKQVFQNWDELTVFGEDQYMSGAQYTDTMLYDQQGDIGTLEDLLYMKNLQVLALYNQNISDLSPLKELTNLKAIGLGENQISDLTSLSKLRGLIVLDISANPISNNALASIENLPRLEELNAGGTNIMNFDGLRGMKLTTLNLYGVQLWNCDGIQEMTTLKHLIISGINLCITVRGLEDICELTGLETLNIMGGDKFDLSILAPLKSLYFLGLCDIPIDNIKALKGMKLRQLTLDFCQMSDLSDLKYLNLLQIISIRSIPCDDYTVLKSLPYLESVICDSDAADRIKEQLGEDSYQFNIPDFGK